MNIEKSEHDAQRDLARDPSRDLSRPPRLSVVVPVHNGERDFDACLAALSASDIPRTDWELIVVDDASTDTSAEIAAKYAERIINIDAPARGPAYARNRGIEAAYSPMVAFVDADVMVHADALQIMLARLSEDDVAAVFGSYDDRPAGRSIVSQYRNLLHRFIHQRSAGWVDSFWAGCGAAKKEVLESVGLFDEERFRRPEMEDVELGYRLRDAGHRIFLDPAVQCTHRKRITFANMIASDFSRRGIPWTRLLLDRKMLNAPRGLSLGASERLSALATGLFVLSLAISLFEVSVIFAMLAFTALIVFVSVNGELFATLARARGAAFLLAAIPLHLVHNLTAVSALVWATITHPFIRSARESYKPTR